jgi:putative ABC transport system substrate-binding protein
MEGRLRELGYVDGETVKIEVRWGQGRTETLPTFAAELVRLKPAVIVAIGRPSIEAARAATKELPIVALDLESDPIASGYVASWAAPGGNLSGLFLDLPGLTGKWMQLIREVVPEARRIAVLWDATTGEYQLRAISAVAKTASVDLQVLEFRNAASMENALGAGLKERPQALIQLGSPLISQLGKRIAEIVAAHDVPAISQFRSFSEGGGLMSYGPVLSAWFRALGPYVSAILKGAKPATLPVEQPTNFELIVNAKAAAALGIKVPQSILLGADEVIE